MKLVFVVALALAFSSAAFAKSKKHCMNSDGTENASAASKKQCKKSGGKWLKMKSGASSSTTMPK
ncbi:MAG TPA: hypothetical protein VN177_00155 [Myxococcales bacterium]|nr:hypothetical protein [Myxococcales bacterium]